MNIVLVVMSNGTKYKLASGRGDNSYKEFVKRWLHARHCNSAFVLQIEHPEYGEVTVNPNLISEVIPMRI